MIRMMYIAAILAVLLPVATPSHPSHVRHARISPTHDGRGLALTFSLSASTPPPSSLTLGFSCGASSSSSPATLHSYPYGRHTLDVWEGVVDDIHQLSCSKMIQVVVTSPDWEDRWELRMSSLLRPQVVSRGVHAFQTWASSACASKQGAGLPGMPLAEEVVVGLVADTWIQDEAKATLNAMAHSDPPLDLAVHLGDYGYADRDDPNPWNVQNEDYLDVKRNHWDAFLEIARPLFATTPLVTVRGNHEAPPFGLSHIFDAQFFNPRFPHRKHVPDPPQPWYATSFGDLLHLIVLDSESDLGLDSPQGRFASAQLEKSYARTPRTGSFTLVLIHRSPYSSSLHKGSHLGLRSHLETLMAPFPGAVDLVLHGHDHSLEITHPVRDGNVMDWSEAPIYVRLGVGGLETREGWKEPTPLWSDFRAGNIFGYVRLILSTHGSLTLQIVNSMDDNPPSLRGTVVYSTTQTKSLRCSLSSGPPLFRALTSVNPFSSILAILVSFLVILLCMRLSRGSGKPSVVSRISSSFHPCPRKDLAHPTFAERSNLVLRSQQHPPTHP